MITQVMFWTFPKTESAISPIVRNGDATGYPFKYFLLQWSVISSYSDLTARLKHIYRKSDEEHDKKVNNSATKRWSRWLFRNISSSESLSMQSSLPSHCTSLSMTGHRRSTFLKVIERPLNKMHRKQNWCCLQQSPEQQ